jgi:hypothetical protein
MGRMDFMGERSASASEPYPAEGAVGKQIIEKKFRN